MFFDGAKKIENLTKHMKKTHVIFFYKISNCNTYLETSLQINKGFSSTSSRFKAGNRRTKKNYYFFLSLHSTEARFSFCLILG